MCEKFETCFCVIKGILKDTTEKSDKMVVCGDKVKYCGDEYGCDFDAHGCSKDSRSKPF